MLPRCLMFSGLMLALLRPVPDVVQVGRNIAVPANQQLQSVTCILCSTDIDGHISGRVRAFAGNVSLHGTVDGTIMIFGGHAYLAAGSVVGGSVIVIGGHLQQDAGARCSRHTVLPPIIFLVAILLICIVMGTLIRLTRRSIQGPIVFPPLPRL